MKELAGYPGRGIFVGRVRGKPGFVYFVTGRSMSSKARRAVINGQEVSIVGEGKDPLRHYGCVRLAGAHAYIANGSHLDAVARPMTAPLLSETLKRWGYEPDEFKTPRIAGIAGRSFYLGAVASSAKAFRINPKNDTLYGVITYSGSVDAPKPFRFDEPIVIKINAPTPRECAALFASLLNKLLLVSVVCGMYDGEWHLHAINHFKRPSGS